MDVTIEKFIIKFQDQLENKESVDRDTKFRKDIETWDSLTAMAVLAMIEDEYNISLSDESFLGVETIGELFDLIIKDNNASS